MNVAAGCPHSRLNVEQLPLQTEWLANIWPEVGDQGAAGMTAQAELRTINAVIVSSAHPCLRTHDKWCCAYGQPVHFCRWCTCVGALAGLWGDSLVAAFRVARLGH